MGCKISGWGKALPQLVVTNDDLAEIVDTSDDWIATRTGIRQRRIAVGETSTDLGEQAAAAALRAAGLEPADIDLLVCATITPDAVIPSQACLLKVRMGLENAVSFDINAACAGCIYGMEVASSMLQGSAASASGGGHATNPMRRALVVGVDRLSRIVDWTDRATCVLFADGAGAVVLEWDEAAAGIKASFLKNTDDETLSLACAHLYDTSTFPFGELGVQGREAGQALVPDAAMIADPAGASGDEGALAQPGAGVALLDRPYISMQGQRVFKFATAAIVEAATAVCERAGVSLDEVACIVPHQANERIIRRAAKKLGVPEERFQVSIATVGNTSASSTLMALADAYDEGRILPGDNIVMVGFGGGLTSGALLFEA